MIHHVFTHDGTKAKNRSERRQIWGDGGGATTKWKKYYNKNKQINKQKREKKNNRATWLYGTHLSLLLLVHIYSVITHIRCINTHARTHCLYPAPTSSSSLNVFTFVCYFLWSTHFSPCVYIIYIIVTIRTFIRSFGKGMRISKILSCHDVKALYPNPNDEHEG